jgi:uncharacterized membrane protein YgdD (TMEM256/DUF423 family)
MSSKFAATAAFLLAIAVMCGAFGAHALKDRLDAYHTAVFEKAVFYHFIHALGMLMVAVMPLLQSGGVSLLSESVAGRICLMLAAGVIFFSGSLYLLALTGIRWLGAVTPIGGTLFIASWIYLAVSILRTARIP